jgi:3-oxoacyl-[acyl-carrier-protein] synthase-1
MSTAGPPDLAAVAIIGMGASSPIGYGARPVQAAMAGRLRNFRSAPMLGWNEDPVRVSRLPDVSDSLSRSERIATLVEHAVADLCADIQVEVPGDVAIFVGCAQDAPESELNTVASAVTRGTGGMLDPTAGGIFAGYRAGRIAFLSALAKAMRWFDEGSGEIALVIAADSRCLPETVRHMARERRLLRDRDDGTIPGEAAVAMLVATPNSVLSQHAKLMVARPAFGADDFAILRQSPTATDGLGRAFGALAERPLSGSVRPQCVVAFETGEVFFTRAFQTAYLRNAQLMPEPLQHELIAANLGDTGAAAAGMALVRADWLMRQELDNRAPRVLIYGHADDGRCAAAMVIGRAVEALQ